MSKEIVYQAAVLLGQRKYKEAVQLVESSASALDDDTRVPALLQAFYAAREGGLNAEAKRLARAIAKEDPDLPSIQSFLAR